MRKFTVLAVLTAGFWVSSLHAATTVTPLMSHELPGLSGKEGAMVTVDYGPGDSDPIHRHNASVFVYVLKGSVIMQIKGGAASHFERGANLF